MTTPVQVRSQLLRALELDLVGPPDDDSAHREEILTQAPSKWYLTGFLAPRGLSDDTAEEGVEEMSVGGEDNSPPEATTAKKALFPSSMGLTVFIPADTENLQITVHWADYYPIILPEPPESIEEESTEENAKPLEGWQRKPREITLTVPPKNDTIELAESEGLKLVIKQRSIRFSHLPDGTSSLSVFLVNSRPAPKSTDTAFIFQTRLTLHHAGGFVPRVNPRGFQSLDNDEAIAALQYRHDYEFVVGHNVSTRAEVIGNTCRTVHTDWLPVSEVPRVAPAPIPGVELGMETLAAMGDIGKMQDGLAPLVTEYGDWIIHQRATPIEPSESVPIAKNLLDRAEVARTRIAEGIDLLEDPDIFYAFRLANRAIALARKQQICQEKNCTIESIEEPKWRPFQLAFILLNLASIADSEHDDRQTVDLLFFPTGGGKTEAYLGLAAFTLILRRLKNPGITSAGVSVLMRYTLRLLTLDQLERASRLICALELERQRDLDRLGAWPFEIGLWVGQNATPNKMGQKGDKDEHSAYSRTVAFQKDPKSKPGPIPLERCPWCGESFKPSSFQLFPHDKPKELKIFCTNRRCDFQGDRSLPIVAVDESIYRRLPCFIIATVDKFASLPWVGQTASLFGRVTHFKDGEGFSSAADGGGSGRRLDSYLPPPDLIVQDELHLISGPLGTMVGLYETAIGALCCTPKIIASTATVRRAGQQIRALFNRSQVDVFPPPGPDRHDSFFARTVPIEESSGRLYVGVGATGRSLKVILLRVYLALLAASEKQWELAGGKKNPDNPADPYMTLLGYFNSLRELGGSRRIVEDEVNNRLNKYGERLRYGEIDGYFANRKIDDEPEELTSRVSTNKIANTKRRLSLPYSEKERVDIALATNMISVGLDIVRLGLMVVLGQPKTAAEYIQATSRVGREINKPGLVVTLFNIHRPRDRSHYERFVDWHTNFYRAVEATSVTPFSERALDRGLAGVTVALSRLLIPEMTEPIGASRIVERRADLDRVVEIVTRRAIEHGNLSSERVDRLREKVRNDVLDLLDTWQKIAERETRLQYQTEIDTAVPLLLDAADPNAEKKPFDHQKFKAGRSLRDVEYTVKLRVRDPDGQDVEE
ncbi:DISARM system helicase DrmA [Pannus brasiliensis CCIBt3594]|uniref:DISARM system helicase DrmA n=1 Tax=Pannus brasiliensis CCIBt3594 TaxID=1427578 RepID=A0AAW9QSS4_9CHRO